ncbi:uncharacterized protein [Lolium perenne]|uniref:uncharacterized protein isoform X8 n=1 Tax=Lolium perenne TaxID=4522 RepID=UPI003A994B2D
MPLPPLIPAPQLHCLSSYQGWMVLLVIFLACASTPWYFLLLGHNGSMLDLYVRERGFVFSAMVSSIISSRHAIVSAGCALEALKLVSAYIISVSNYLPFATKTI